MKALKRIIAVATVAVLSFVSLAASQEVTTDDIIRKQKEGNKMIKGIGGVPENREQKRGDEEAAKLKRKYDSQEFQQRRTSEINRIKKFFDTGVWDKPSGIQNADPGSYYDAAATVSTQGARGSLRADERIYVLISSSMPMDTIRNYAYSMARGKDPNVKMMLRGMVPPRPGEAPMMATVRFATTVIAGREGCTVGQEGCEKLQFPGGVMIDPLVFRRYGVTDVAPAIVYAWGVKMVDTGKSEGGSSGIEVKDFYVLYGDASLEYAIDVFRREQAMKKRNTEGLEKLLAAVRGDGNY